MADDTTDPLEEAIELSEQMTIGLRKFRRDLEELENEIMDDDDDDPTPGTGTEADVATAE